MDENALINVVAETTAASDCCLAPVQNVVTSTHDEHDWSGSTFTCTKCGKECAQMTNPRIIELEREVRELRAQPEATA